MRDKQFYVSTDVYRALWMLAKANSEAFDQMTPDELADDVLRNYIREKYPQLFQHQKDVDALEKMLIEGLVPKKPPQGKSE